MKILIIGRLDGWMGIHMNQYAQGYRLLNHEVSLVDYHQFTERWFYLTSLFKNKDIAEVEERTSQLLKLSKIYKPELIIFTGAGLKFNYLQLRDQMQSKFVYYDMDGPAASYFSGELDWIKDLDLLVTVSRRMFQDLQAKGFSQVQYLPHGVDTHHYAPIRLTEDEKTRFSAQVSFVGRSSNRRQELLLPLSDKGLSLWGDRWLKKSTGLPSSLRGCVREKTDIIGDDLNKLYNASNTVLNILRKDAFSEQNTMLSLQAFAIPSSEVCLITEWVEELDDVFDCGKELLVFKTPDELVELVSRYAKDTKLAKKIGIAGRKRCLSHHTHQQRASAVIHFLDTGCVK